MKPLLLALSLLLPLAEANAQDKEKKADALPAKDAKGKVGETITIEAKVAEVNKTEKIVRINLGARFPKQELTLVIFSSNFSKFDDVEKLEGKTVRVTGKVSEYQKRPQIVLDVKEQLKVQEAKDEKK
jgi:DNA/RNA endonuclease YhcR with UshA esterase domain